MLIMQSGGKGERKSLHKEQSIAKPKPCKKVSGLSAIHPSLLYTESWASRFLSFLLYQCRASSIVPTNYLRSLITNSVEYGLALHSYRLSKEPMLNQHCRLL